MRIDGRRRSDNFEDRGSGGGGRRGGGVPIHLVASVVRMLGLKGTLIVGVALGAGYFVLPASVKDQVVAVVAGGPSAPAGRVCEASTSNAKACDFSRVVLASTEDVWAPVFGRGELPKYGAKAGAYTPPTLVVFSGSVSTGGCGGATSASGPFYCPADSKLYIDPTFYQVMEQRLRAPGDFAQAYVIAHEVGHHIQNLIGSTRLGVSGETKNQVSVRVELQADCLAGVWGHSARASLEITDEDLREALNAAHAIGDDTLGHSNARDHTHGTSEQRKRWFKRGFERGDARECDTFAVRAHDQL
ncbi:neutral zinc metallopeptidase [Myxococcota bacterium]|nr:neutral zinc metallopeptidase [Myxococcota bacterium]